MVAVLIIDGILAIIAGIVASNKNRSAVGWFFLTILLPLLLFVLLALKPLPAKPEK